MPDHEPDLGLAIMSALHTVTLASTTGDAKPLEKQTGPGSNSRILTI